MSEEFVYRTEQQIMKRKEYNGMEVCLKSYVKDETEQ